MAAERKKQRQYDHIQLFINEDIRENKLSAIAVAKRNAEAEAEKKL